MADAEVGAIFFTRCTVCGDELSVGWIRVGDEVPVLQDVTKRRYRAPEEPALPEGAPATLVLERDADDIVHGPVECSCGITTLRYDSGKGRARVHWSSGDPPPLANRNVY